MSATSVTARARARAELTDEIKASARRQVAEVGAPGLSLRAVARDVGMVSSAVYRYFASRDELLTALIIDAFDAVGQAAEDAAADTGGGLVKRFMGVASAVRAWALSNPHDYALVYGSPVPGYVAPTDTVSPAVRVNAAALSVVVDSIASGEIELSSGRPIPRTVRADFARIRDEVAPGVPDDVLARVLLAWTAVFGTISFELFGHLHGVVDDYATFFEHQSRRAANLIATGRA
jgi:AcrR family transcriptional regulator